MDMLETISEKLDKMDTKLDTFMERLVKVEVKCEENAASIERSRGWIKAIVLLVLGGLSSMIIAFAKKFV